MKVVRLWKPRGRGECHQLRAIRPDGQSGPGGQLADRGIMEGLTDSAEPAARQNAQMSGTAERDPGASTDGTRHTLSYGQYRLAYEVYGSGDRVLVWLHGLLLDANLGRGLARALAAQGNRVVLLDLLGHGRSDKPRHAGLHRMDLCAKQVLCLLDELGVDQAVLGGVSLGTNVSLLTSVEAPERVRGLILEMPVLERAVPAAALVFLPLLLWAHYARPWVRLVSRAGSRLPRSGLGPLHSFINAAVSDPDEIAAVLHGVLLGPIAPTIGQRRSITAPALVLGHGIDLIHSFSDARNLARQLPDSRLIRTHSFAELWVRPARLTAAIGEFLDRVWTDVELQEPRDEAS
jgi:pimeloyl-ACP methyl ester carboxylesterase